MWSCVRLGKPSEGLGRRPDDARFVNERPTAKHDRTYMVVLRNDNQSPGDAGPLTVPFDIAVVQMTCAMVKAENDGDKHVTIRSQNCVIHRGGDGETYRFDAAPARQKGGSRSLSSAQQGHGCS